MFPDENRNLIRVPDCNSQVGFYDLEPFQEKQAIVLIFGVSINERSRKKQNTEEVANWRKMARTRAAELYLEEQKPIRRSLAYCLKKNFHWKCFSLTFIVLLCLASIAFCQIRYQSYINVRKYMLRFEHLNSFIKCHSVFCSLKGPCQQGYNFIPVAFVVMLYIVYIMECWHCKNGMDTVPKADMNFLEDYLAQLKAADPIVWWRALCYHYVRKSRQHAACVLTFVKTDLYHCGSFLDHQPCVANKCS
uniref:Uncharacterized protein n=1 Tax=Romanomermis culicivorax TaxID=13658 RepID=A0A915KII1_ROMCU